MADISNLLTADFLDMVPICHPYMPHRLPLSVTQSFQVTPPTLLGRPRRALLIGTPLSPAALRAASPTRSSRTERTSQSGRTIQFHSIQFISFIKSQSLTLPYPNSNARTTTRAAMHKFIFVTSVQSASCNFLGSASVCANAYAGTGKASLESAEYVIRSPGAYRCARHR